MLVILNESKDLIFGLQTSSIKILEAKKNIWWRSTCSCQVYHHQEKLCRSDKGVYLIVIKNKQTKIIKKPQTKQPRREKIGYIVCHVAQKRLCHLLHEEY